MFLSFYILPSPCENLNDLVFPDTTIQSAELVSTGDLTISEDNVISDLPELCRITGIISPSIQFEVWLPITDWNNRFQMVGNGGFAGSINYSDMASAVKNGFATASTDTGHKGDSREGAWAVGRPDLVEDFGHRAVHETAVKSKLIIEAFYSEGTAYSYFVGCSNGGRQGIKEALHYPDEKIQETVDYFHNPDFSKFEELGNKIIFYHGWDENLVSSNQKTVRQELKLSQLLKE